MGFNTSYRFSVHAAIFDEDGRVLLLKAKYIDSRWGLPGGGVEPNETVHEAILRECKEEIGIEVEIDAFTGIYYHHEFNSQVGIFRCKLPNGAQIKLSTEHSEYQWFELSALGETQQIRVRNAMTYGGKIASKVF